MMKNIATALALIAVLGLAGCLLSLTETFDYNVTDRTGPLELAGTDGEIASIDLTEESTFDDNKDKIKNVDRVGFEAWAYTSNAQDAVIDIEFRAGDKDEWTLLLAGAPVSGASTATAPDRITYEKSEKLIRNFALFQKLAEKGVMQLRVRASGGNDQVVVPELVLVITLTAGT